MMNYIEIHFDVLQADTRDLLVAMLPSFGFSGMEETEFGLKAYAMKGMEDMLTLDALCSQLKVQYTNTILEEQNWNSSWESNFDPVVIPGKIHVRAHFHPSLDGFEHEILITPKMSFGTGHHATTRMMMKGMLEMNVSEKTVLDFGTGTGILAILAERLGASEIEAIDNDNWSISNVRENIALNHATRIRVAQADNLDDSSPCDLMLANINKHVLLEQVAPMVNLLQPGGILLMSGLLESDYTDIVEAFSPYLGQPVQRYTDSGWIALSFRHPF